MLIISENNHRAAHRLGIQLHAQQLGHGLVARHRDRPAFPCAASAPGLRPAMPCVPGEWNSSPSCRVCSSEPYPSSQGFDGCAGRSVCIGRAVGRSGNMVSSRRATGRSGSMVSSRRATGRSGNMVCSCAGAAGCAGRAGFAGRIGPIGATGVSGRGANGLRMGRAVPPSGAAWVGMPSRRRAPLRVLGLSVARHALSRLIRRTVSRAAFALGLLAQVAHHYQYDYDYD